MGSVKSQISTLENDYNWLDKIKKEKLAKIDELYSKIKPIQAEIESLEEELESVDEASGVIAQSLWDLESERQMILFDLRTAAEKVIS
jgi:chromosome segregation ATPase